MRISFRSESRKCFRTVEPKEPVPPVIIRVALSNADILIFLLYRYVCVTQYIQIMNCIVKKTIQNDYLLASSISFCSISFLENLYFMSLAGTPPTNGIIRNI